MGVDVEIERPCLVEMATRNFDEWFDKYVEPVNQMLAEGVEVYAEEHDYGWSAHQSISGNGEYTALLINIQPIKKETPEDVLRDVVKYFHPDDYGHGATDKTAFDILARAKAALGES